jgi:hypothetical protein
VLRRLASVSHAVGFDVLVLNFSDHLDELPYFAQELLPRLGPLRPAQSSQRRRWRCLLGLSA